MGAEPWHYFAPYEPSVESALHKLRQRVFASGKFRGSFMNPKTPEEAVEMTEADGTASILDITRVSPTPDFCAVCPLSEAQLRSYFGTTQPTRSIIQKADDFYDDIERGQGIYIVLNEDGKPDEYFFAGYSFD